MLIVHSNDGGVDDILVLWLLLKDADRIICFPSQGCTDQAQAFKNCRDLFNCTGKKGATLSLVNLQTQLVTTPPKTERFFGSNGLNNLSFEDLLIQENNNKFSILSDFPPIEQAFHWLETGPCTNLARTLDARPEVIRSLQSVTIMGGAFEPPGLVGDIDPETGSPCAEFNWYHDPGSVFSVLKRLSEENVPVMIVPWETCRKLSFTEAELKNRAGTDKVSERLRQMTLEFFELYPSGDAETGNPESASYAPADIIAYRAMMVTLGTSRFFSTRECNVHIQDNPNLPLFGKSRITKDSGHRVHIVDLNDREIPDLKESIFQELEWM